MCTLGNYWKIWQIRFFFLWIRIGKFCLFLKNLFFSGCFHKKETISELKNIVIFATLCRSSAFGNLHIIQPQNLASSFHMEVVLVFGMTQWCCCWWWCDLLVKNILDKGPLFILLTDWNTRNPRNYIPHTYLGIGT